MARCGGPLPSLEDAALPLNIPNLYGRLWAGLNDQGNGLTKHITEENRTIQLPLLETGKICTEPIAAFAKVSLSQEHSNPQTLS